MNHCLPAMDRVLSSSTHVRQLGVEYVAPGIRLTLVTSKRRRVASKIPPYKVHAHDI